MNQHKMALALLSLLAAAASSCAPGQPADTASPTVGQSPDDRGQGEPFSLLAMAHTSRVENPSHRVEGPPIKTTPWNGEQEGGPFSYSSIRCIDDAPLNNIATNLTTYNSRLPNSHSPASVRLQPLQFNVLNGGSSGEVRGTITLVACGVAPAEELDLEETTPDNERDQVRFDWRANYEKTSSQEVAWTGTFEIKQGTGAYQGITGSGDISGYFFCFGKCNPGQPFRDTQLTMIGTYNAPNIPSPSGATASPTTSPTASPTTSPASSPTSSPTPSPTTSPTTSPPAPSPTSSPAAGRQ